jgi:hypothetical protein
VPLPTPIVSGLEGSPLPLNIKHLKVLFNNPVQINLQNYHFTHAGTPQIKQSAFF